MKDHKDERPEPSYSMTGAGGSEREWTCLTMLLVITFMLFGGVMAAWLILEYML